MYHTTCSPESPENAVLSWDPFHSVLLAFQPIRRLQLSNHRLDNSRLSFMVVSVMQCPSQEGPPHSQTTILRETDLPSRQPENPVPYDLQSRKCPETTALSWDPFHSVLLAFQPIRRLQLSNHRLDNSRLSFMVVSVMQCPSQEGPPHSQTTILRETDLPSRQPENPVPYDLQSRKPRKRRFVLKSFPFGSPTFPTDKTASIVQSVIGQFSSCVYGCSSCVASLQKVIPHTKQLSQETDRFHPHSNMKSLVSQQSSPESALQLLRCLSSFSSRSSGARPIGELKLSNC